MKAFKLIQYGNGTQLVMVVGTTPRGGLKCRRFFASQLTFAPEKVISGKDPRWVKDITADDALGIIRTATPNYCGWSRVEEPARREAALAEVR